MRRAAGHDQRAGALGRVFAVTSVIGAVVFAFWLLLINGAEFAAVGINLERGRAGMGLLDYYRQFEGLSEEEVNAELRERGRASAAATRSPASSTLDLSQTTWPELPHPDVVTAITFVARRGHATATPTATAHELRHELAERHGVEPDRLVVGNGAAELLRSAAARADRAGRRAAHALALLPAVPADGARAGARAVPVPRLRRRAALLDAVNERTRVARDLQPQRPDRRATCRAGELDELLGGLPEDVAVLLDEALVRLRRRPAGRRARWRCSTTTRACSCSAASPRPGASPACARLRDRRRRAREALLAALEPASASPSSPGRRAGGAAQPAPAQVARAARAGRGRARAGCSTRCATLPVDVTASQANFAVAARPGHDGVELAAGCARGGVLVAPGAAVGATSTCARRSRAARPRSACLAGAALRALGG